MPIATSSGCIRSQAGGERGDLLEARASFGDAKTHAGDFVEQHRSPRSGSSRV